MRKGMGIGSGKSGYYNLVPKDPYIHSLSAKGVKTKEYYMNYGMFPTQKKKGLIKEIARKVHEGVDWAIEWEKKHLPSQKAWVQKEYAKAKEELGHLAQKGKGWLSKLQKKQDLADVRDELDTNDDGVQDVHYDDLMMTNQGIVQDLDTIDTNQNMIPDHREENFTDVSTTTIVPYPEIPIPPLNPEPEYEVESETGIGFPYPFIEPEEKPKTIIEKTGDFAKKEFKSGKQFVQRKIAERKAEIKELREMSDNELKTLAIREGKPLFGSSNKYEKEVLRREQEKMKLAKQIQDIRQGKKPKDGTGGADFFGFLNPFSATSNKEPDRKSSSSNVQYPSFVNPLSTFQTRPSVDKRLRPSTKEFSPFGFINPFEAGR